MYFPAASTPPTLTVSFTKWVRSIFAFIGLKKTDWRRCIRVNIQTHHSLCFCLSGSSRHKDRLSQPKVTPHRDRTIRIEKTAWEWCRLTVAVSNPHTAPKQGGGKNDGFQSHYKHIKKKTFLIVHQCLTKVLFNFSVFSHNECAMPI